MVKAELARVNCYGLIVTYSHKPWSQDESLTKTKWLLFEAALWDVYLPLKHCGSNSCSVKLHKIKALMQRQRLQRSTNTNNNCFSLLGLTSAWTVVHTWSGCYLSRLSTNCQFMLWINTLKQQCCPLLTSARAWLKRCSCTFSHSSPLRLERLQPDQGNIYRVGDWTAVTPQRP